MNTDREQDTVDETLQLPQQGIAKEQELDVLPRAHGDRALPMAGVVRWMIIAEKLIAGLFLVVIVATMSLQVIARYLFDNPYQWSEELSRFALIWMTFMSAAYVMAEGRHIAVDMLSMRFGERGRLVLEVGSYILITVTCMLLVFGGAKFVWYVGKVGSPTLGLPKSLWYGACLVGLSVIAIHCLINLLQVCVTGKPIPRESTADEEAFHLQMEPNK